ncbi:branched-chain amino acid ABC transporter permease [Oceanicella sp. SM1341]|uniref:branched-chain amino acid ABC transporter permease n=1 Tax=Oceanicella sp. SM1341 TaxID=1548889 RepID=UPI000E51CFDD|nr:branched-chain amino acid ABC transporter permease [Oceanicella sp. SM1341]
MSAEADTRPAPRALPAGLAPVALLALLGLLAALPALAGAYWLSVALQLLSMVALTQSWVAFSGMTGYASLGYAAFYGLGAYVMAVFWRDIPLWGLLPLAGLASGALALVVGYVALRVRGPYFVILTLGIAEFVKFVVIALEAASGSSGRLLFGGPSPAALYWIMLGLAVAATLLTRAIGRSRFGIGLRTIREDETAAVTIGVPATRLKTLAFTLSALIPGMVGAVWVLRATYFEPMQMFSPATSFSIITMAIIGGSDRASGAVLGAVFVGLLSELLWSTAPQLYLVILGVLLVGFVLFVPEGLSGRLAALAGRARA